MSHSATMTPPQTAPSHAAPARPRRPAVRSPRILTIRRRPVCSRLGDALVRLHRNSATDAIMAPVEPVPPRIEDEIGAVRHSAPRVEPAKSAPPNPSTPVEAESVGGPVRERRAFPRRESICLVSVYRNEQDAPVNQQEIRWLLHSSPLKGAIDDISMNGVAFLLHEPLEAGAKLLMRLINRRLDRHFDTSGRVVRAIPDGMGEWKIVCRFDRNLSLDQVHEYGQNLFVSGLV